ncbi:MAG: carboxypeptidase regulatory-like domain-containing protein [Vicinamibacteraceae bacterium]
MVLSRSLLAVALMGVLPGISLANGVIRGRVTSPPRDPVAHRPSLMQPPVHAPDGDSRPVSVVYLERAPRGAFEDNEQRRYRMDQRGERFVPHVLAIRTGSLVHFPNSDPFFHNVFSLSRTRSFDLGRYARGRSRAVRFDRPGIVRVFCDIHSHMSAFILVFAHRYFALTDEEGNYRIENVPPGTYSLAVWHETLPTATRTVTVPEGGNVAVDFTLVEKATEHQRASPEGPVSPKQGERGLLSPKRSEGG